MKVTVCELGNDTAQLKSDWQALVEHVQAEASDLVLLPEMPFYPWPAHTRQVDAYVWQASVDAHNTWLQHLPELAPATVLGSRPVVLDGRRLNEGFVWLPGSGYEVAHHKYYLPDEAGFWEASWYQRGDRNFAAIQAGPVRVGFLICTEMWFSEHARAYAKQGIDLLVCPRATPDSSADKWVAGGRTAAVVAGAYCLSSNRGGRDCLGAEWAGAGWIVEPEEGQVLGITSPLQPFLTCEIDPAVAKAAKNTYPRYVRE